MLTHEVPPIHEELKTSLLNVAQSFSIELKTKEEMLTWIRDNTDLEEVEDSTYIPRAGPESGIPHHYFTESELRKTFNSFEILDLYIDATGHRCLLGEQK